MGRFVTTHNLAPPNWYSLQFQSLPDKVIWKSLGNNFGWIILKIWTRRGLSCFNIIDFPFIFMYLFVQELAKLLKQGKVKLIGKYSNPLITWPYAHFPVSNFQISLLDNYLAIHLNIYWVSDFVYQSITYTSHSLTVLATNPQPFFSTQWTLFMLQDPHQNPFS